MPPSDAAMILNAVNHLREELMGRIDRLDDKVDSLARNGCAKGAQHEDVEKRLRSLELDKAKIAGIVAAVSTAVTAVGWFITQLLQK